MPTLRFHLLLGLLLLALALLNLAIGSVPLDLSEVWAALTGKASVPETTRLIVLHVRLPQMLVALAAGGALGMGGAVVQTLFGNPLADPGLLGIGTGATLGAAVATLLLGALSLGTWQLTGFWLTLLLAMVGAMAVLALLLIASHWLRSSTSLIIVGVMVGAVSASLIGLLSYTSDGQMLRQLTAWTLGDFARLGTARLAHYLLVLLPAVLFLPLLSRPLDALLLGEDYARSLGWPIRRLRWLLLLLVGWLTAVVSSVCGPISFVGLAAPHLSRLLLRRATHRHLLPSAFLLGALLCLLCLLLSRLPWLVSPLPINTLTPLIGAPIVVALLLKR